MKTVAALFLPYFALLLAVTVWGILAIYSPFSLSLWKAYPVLVTYSSLALALLPLLGLAAWLFCRAVVIHTLAWSAVAAFMAILAFVVPSLFEPIVAWSTSTTFFSIGLALFPALVWLNLRLSVMRPFVTR
jgi:hypothetical protein